jgi:hypothetical protein
MQGSVGSGIVCVVIGVFALRLFVIDNIGLWLGGLAVALLGIAAALVGGSPSQNPFSYSRRTPPHTWER